MNLNKEHSSSLNAPSKSIATGTFLETSIESGFIVLTFQNETDELKVLEKAIDTLYSVSFLP